jgi:hypothetical protein
VTQSQLQRLCDAANALRIVPTPKRFRLQRIQSGPMRCGIRPDPARRRHK